MDRFAATLSPERPRKPEIYTEVPPLAVDLGERATALAAIMTYLNYAAKTEGAKRAGASFVNRYGERSPSVLRAMDAKRSDLRAGFDLGLDTLIAGEALRARNVDPEEIEAERLAMQAAINRRFGVNKSNAHDRAEVVSAAKSTIPQDPIGS